MWKHCLILLMIAVTGLQGRPVPSSTEKTTYPPFVFTIGGEAFLMKPVNLTTQPTVETTELKTEKYWTEIYVLKTTRLPDAPRRHVTLNIYIMKNSIGRGDYKKDLILSQDITDGEDIDRIAKQEIDLNIHLRGDPSLKDDRAGIQSTNSRPRPLEKEKLWQEDNFENSADIHVVDRNGDNKDQVHIHLEPRLKYNPESKKLRIFTKMNPKNKQADAVRQIIPLIKQILSNRPMPIRNNKSDININVYLQTDSALTETDTESYIESLILKMATPRTNIGIGSQSGGNENNYKRPSTGIDKADNKKNSRVKIRIRGNPPLRTRIRYHKQPRKISVYQQNEKMKNYPAHDLPPPEPDQPDAEPDPEYELSAQDKAVIRNGFNKFFRLLKKRMYAKIFGTSEIVMGQ